MSGGFLPREGEVVQRHRITWRGIPLTVTFTPDWFGVAEHLEIEMAGCVPLPVTETGYRSHFMTTGSVASYGARSPS